MKSRVHRVLLVTVLIVALVAVIGIYLSHDGWNSGSTRPSVQPPAVENEKEQLPDLIITQVQWSTRVGYAKHGEPITFTVTIGNIGNAAADATLLGLRYWGPDGRVSHMARNVNPIPAGHVATVLFEDVTPGVAGVTSFVFFADAEERLTESNEGNNEWPTMTLYLQE